MAPWGLKNGQICFVLPSRVFRIHKGPGSAVSPSGLRPFPKTRFGPGTPETGPNCVFAQETQQSYGKRVTWVHSARPVHRSFWVRYQKWTLPFGPLGPEKRPKQPVSGHRREKNNRRLQGHRNFGLMNKRPATARFSPTIRFPPPTSQCSLGWWYEVAISM